MKVLFYCSDSGRPYVKKFLESLDVDLAYHAASALELLSQKGPGLGMPHSKYLGSGLFELRVVGKIQVRFFYSFTGEAIWILHAIKKKTQKIPLSDLKLARERLSGMVEGRGSEK
jgi:phage-related protein